MSFTVSPSVAHPTCLRRQHTARREHAFQHSSHVASNNLDLEYTTGNLDLSIHHPTSSFGNRFATLAVPEPAHRRDRGLHSSSTYRRCRNSRGTKDAKKRRDARRNSRKFAAQLLDQQLSRDIDETLNRMNIYPPPPISVARQTAVAEDKVGASQPAEKVQPDPTIPSAPQLPPIKFRGFQPENFTQMFIPKLSPPPSTPPKLVGVPSWSPSIPSWSTKTKETKPVEAKCQELQLWSLSSSRYTPQKQSRFFPSPVSSRAIVKLPSTICKSYETIHRGTDPISSSTLDRARPFSIADAVEKFVAAAVMVGAQGEHCQLPSAANLWHILTEETARAPCYSEASQRSSWDDESGGVPIMSIVDGECPPYELEGKQMQLVHSNTLVGHANEVAARHSGNKELADSAIYLADLISQYDEDLPYELSATVWPSTAPGIMNSSSATTVHAEGLPGLDPEAGRAERDDSTAHFTSEQDLFKQADHSIVSKSPPTSTCDLATFLKMGHVENCWCRECEETSEIGHEETLTDDEEWLEWSEGYEDSLATTTTVKAEEKTADDWNKTAVEEDSYDAEHCLENEFRDWEEIVPCTSRHPRHVIDDEPEEDFLGYWDDGPAFARENEFDWVWNF
ncbi:hypothetical protein TI39_contig5875g00002 [Zymoseptoria brevis]|uniref:Uncharacterized protein n=1 Tax=Zymoseptoria brevis TaxID=1047168 RepID=A0A0F4G7S4_9PEZI|nr:hypothetical protein TI39_contig5875g00002 [Zymoseptoria brevis]